MWRLGFFFHEMGFGLLSIFLPLYVINVMGGSLVQLGIMASAALFLSIPFSYVWGYLCDKTKRYKRYILISFLASTVFLYLFTLTMSVELLIVLYVAMSVLHVAHEDPKNVLIAELYPHEQWKRGYAFYEGLTEFGWLVGLILGLFTSFYGIGPVNVLLLCSGLNFIAFVLSVFLVADPILVFERGLVNIERAVDFTFRGALVASKVLDGVRSNERLRRESVTLLGLGLVLFSLATSVMFTPMPIFVSNVVTSAGVPQSLIFAVFVVSSGGAVAGYFLAGQKATLDSENRNLGKVVMSRSLLAVVLIAVVLFPFYSVGLTAVILMAMGFAYAIFIVQTLSLSMELIPAGKAGLFNVLIGVGGAAGSFVGPFVAQSPVGFIGVFLVAGGIFLTAYIAFKLFAR